MMHNIISNWTETPEETTRNKIPKEEYRRGEITLGRKTIREEFT